MGQKLAVLYWLSFGVLKLALLHPEASAIKEESVNRLFQAFLVPLPLSELSEAWQAVLRKGEAERRCLPENTAESGGNCKNMLIFPIF